MTLTNIKQQDFEEKETKDFIRVWLKTHNNRILGIKKENNVLFDYIINTYPSNTETKRRNAEIMYNYLNCNNDIPVCPVCNSTPRQFTTLYKGYKEFCGQKCAAKGSSYKRIETMTQLYGEKPYSNKILSDKRKQTNLKKYGHTSVLQSTHGKRKAIETNLKKYGVEHYSKTSEYKQKFTNTMNERYGVDYAMQSEELKTRYQDSLENNYGVRHPSQSSEIYENRNKVMKDKFGVEHAMQSDQLKTKHKASLQNHYGVDYPLQSPEVRETMRNTMMNRYGKEYSAQVDFIFEKLKQTNLNRYGVEFPIQNENIQEKVKQTNLDRYGVEFPIIIQSAEMREKASINRRETMEQQGKWIRAELLSDAEKYYKQVWKHTNKQSISLLEHYESRGLAGIDGAYHLDHKVSIKFGFENNIPPYIIGNINNLEMLPWKDNVYKSSKCSIPIDVLCSLVFTPL